VLYTDSLGMVALAVNGGSAQELLHIGRGYEVVLAPAGATA
jgi:hypothetical protein